MGSSMNNVAAWVAVCCFACSLLLILFALYQHRQHRQELRALDEEDRQHQQHEETSEWWRDFHQRRKQSESDKELWKQRIEATLRKTTMIVTHSDICNNTKNSIHATSLGNDIPSSALPSKSPHSQPQQHMSLQVLYSASSYHSQQNNDPASSSSNPHIISEEESGDTEEESSHESCASSYSYASSSSPKEDTKRIVSDDQEDTIIANHRSDPPAFSASEQDNDEEMGLDTDNTPNNTADAPNVDTPTSPNRNTKKDLVHNYLNMLCLSKSQSISDNATLQLPVEATDPDDDDVNQGGQQQRRQRQVPCFCSICLGSYKEDERVSWSTMCSHAFHTDCLMHHAQRTLVQEQQSAARSMDQTHLQSLFVMCPLCRRPYVHIPPVSTDDLNEAAAIIHNC